MRYIIGVRRWGEGRGGIITNLLSLIKIKKVGDYFIYVRFAYLSLIT